MTIYKCDVCKKVIKERYPNSVDIDYPVNNRFVLCLKCANPIRLFLVKNKLMNKGESEKTTKAKFRVNNK